MNVSCPRCETTYRIDPEKVPTGGVRARCSHCAEVFPIGRAEAGAQPANSAGPEVPTDGRSQAPGSSREQRPPPRQVEPAVTGAVRSSGATPTAPGSMSAGRTAPAAAPERPSDAPDGVGAGGAEAGGAEARPRPSPAFGATDPDSKARRLARALVSDMVVYHPDRRERSLAAGTLRQEFREEIQKSWEEYVGQVGEALARKSPHFRDALNEILAGGQRVF